MRKLALFKDSKRNVFILLTIDEVINKIRVSTVSTSMYSVLQWDENIIDVTLEYTTVNDTVFLLDLLCGKIDQTKIVKIEDFSNHHIKIPDIIYTDHFNFLLIPDEMVHKPEIKDGKTILKFIPVQMDRTEVDAIEFNKEPDFWFVKDFYKLLIFNLKPELEQIA